MALHSYSRCWLHLVWATLERKPLLTKATAAKLSSYLTGYAKEKCIYMRINYVNSDHVHALIDLPVTRPIEEVLQLFKGSSSHWVNENNLVAGKFGWQRGYGAFSVSHSNIEEVGDYIANQEEHHRHRTFGEELKLFVDRYGLQWHEEENR
jgi:REP element-mobilizing transposase RayT